MNDYKPFLFGIVDEPMWVFSVYVVQETQKFYLQVLRKHHSQRKKSGGGGVGIRLTR